MNGAYANSFFALKAYLADHPYTLLSLAIFFLTILLGFVLRTFERTSGDEGNNFNYAWNAFWVIILTMTTIGYGDIYPVTHLGRISAVLACMVGVFIISLFVVALNNTTEFKETEFNAYKSITLKREIGKIL
jgi:hypothetical protein